MHNNFKNYIQEYAQKNKLAMPVYTHVKIGTFFDHTPIWESALFFQDQQYIDQGTNKKEADMKVAKMCYDNLMKKSNSVYFDNNNCLTSDLLIPNKLYKYNEIRNYIQAEFDDDNIFYSNVYKDILLIDGENIEISSIPFLEKYISFIVISKNCTRKFPNNITLLVTQAVSNDAADFFISFILGMISILRKTNNQKIFILTRDKFGQNLEKFIDNCHYVCSYDEVIQFKD